MKSYELLSILRREFQPESRWVSLPLTAILIAISAYGQMPDGPGRAEAKRLCVGCHEIEKSIARRQDMDGWGATLTKMVSLGMEATEEELYTLLAYLTKNFPAEALPPLNVNKARAIQFESRLSLKRSEAAKIIRYRTKNGNFESIEDLKKVSGINTTLIDAKKDTLIF